MMCFLQVVSLPYFLSHYLGVAQFEGRLHFANANDLRSTAVAPAAADALSKTLSGLVHFKRNCDLMLTITTEVLFPGFGFDCVDKDSVGVGFLSSTSAQA